MFLIFPLTPVGLGGVWLSAHYPGHFPVLYIICGGVIKDIVIGSLAVGDPFNGELQITTH